MSLFSRIAWIEGMPLLPQHFQQAERSLEAAAQMRLQASQPLYRGFLSFQLDEAAIAQGRLELSRCQAIMPDGLILDVPEIDPAPPSRTIQLAASTRSLDVYLTVPASTPRAQLMTADPQRADIRYLQQVLEVPDALDPTRIEPIDVAVKNLRFAVEGDSLEGLVALKIAQVHRTPEGVLAFRQDFVPPVIRLKAAPTLERLCRQLIELIAARTRALADARRPQGGQLAMDSAEILNHWFLHSLSLHLPVLQHLLELPGSHPARIYEELLRLTGALYPFSLDGDLELPSYDHDALYSCFFALDRRLRQLLTRMFRPRYEAIPLARKDSYWLGDIVDPDLRARGAFTLAVTSDLSPAELMTRFTNTCKLAERDDLGRIVRLALPGIRITPLARAPEPMRTRGDACYFQIVTEGPDWERLRTSGHLAMLIPTFLPGVKAELYGIHPGGAS